LAKHGISSGIAKDGGGGFKDRKPQERRVVVMHGWQSKSIDGPTGGWSCVFGVVAAVTSTTTAGCSVA